MTGRDTHPGAFALAAVRRGWRVFPLTPGGKPPASGFTDWERKATTDPARIRAMWSRSRFNVGIATGPSGLIVIDLDLPKPGETVPPEWTMPGVNNGADAFALLCERHGQPFPFETFTVKTRRGGMHLYFTAPDRVQLRNTAGSKGKGLGWCIDTRAHGGYVVGPGSFVDLPDGTGPYTVTHNAPAAPLPDWLTELLTSPAAPPSLSASVGVGDLDAYVQTALKEEAARVRDAQPGGRNFALNKAAYNLGRLVAADVLPEDLARVALTDAVSVHFASGSFTPAEATATITAGLAAGTRNPRTITKRTAA
ncbi:bifunctional DNA primase/polymerase [Thermomonospora umbrina]|uniref:Bifunctional DNA primase/polymerase-like protein n=1 Tax=Thermomonospora umbrina TaxID=111806 RepID=A0A3D9SRP0_9ACTN|nr:bifunctional DNA primase/polymerase [Thermomonospora umbrina]REE96633.1 bifunctional DNA primase/polymerase-like protein [Thermomonospora umbrina]